MLGNRSTSIENFKIIVIGASAGGVEVLTQLVRLLPPDLAAAVLIVLHFPSYGVSVLPDILNRAGSLPAKHPKDGEALQAGQIYVAPPDYHLLVERGRVCLSRAPKENGHRPAIDVLFRSAAMAYQQRVIGVILTGLLDDGTAGLAMIKQQGGLTLVQDPKEALFDGMPTSAIAKVEIDYVLPISKIAEVLARSCPSSWSTSVGDLFDPGLMTIAQDKAAAEQGELQKEPSIFTCPSCGGGMWELNSDGLMRYRCHVGHIYSADSLAAEQADAIESALWTAARTLEERASLARRLAQQAWDDNRPRSADQFMQMADEAVRHVEIIRQIIEIDNIKSAFKSDLPSIDPP